MKKYIAILMVCFASTAYSVSGFDKIQSKCKEAGQLLLSYVRKQIVNACTFRNTTAEQRKDMFSARSKVAATLGVASLVSVARSRDIEFPCKRALASLGFFGGSYYCYKQAQQIEHALHKQQQDERARRSCPICMTEGSVQELDNFWTLGCKHTFCKNCLRGIIDQVISTKKTTYLRCPTCQEHKVHGILSEDDIREMVGDSTILFDGARIYKHEAIHAIKESERPDYRHCSRPGCRATFRYKAPMQTVTCPLECGSSYCNNCVYAHLPTVSCEAAAQERGQQRSQEWITGNTKQCPNCPNRIEKNNGCNHMTCKCKHEFCWVCMGPWTEHRNRENASYRCPFHRPEGVL